MRVGVEIVLREATRAHAEPQRLLVETRASMETRLVLDVECAELGHDGADHGEPGLANIGRGHLYRVGGREAPCEPPTDRLDLLLRSIAAHPEDPIDVAALRRCVEELGPMRVARVRIETDVVVEVANLAGYRRALPAWVEAAKRLRPRAYARGLIERLCHGALDRHGCSGADAERRASRNGAANDGRTAGDVPDPAHVDYACPQSGRTEEPVLPLDEPLVPPPLEQRPAEPRLPREHERVALEQLEQGRERRLRRVCLAGEAAARRAADPRLVAVRDQMHERGGKPGRLAAGEGGSLDPREAGVSVEADIGKAGRVVLPVRVQGEARRIDRPRPELAGGGDHESLGICERCRVALDRLPDRGRARWASRRSHTTSCAGGCPGGRPGLPALRGRRRRRARRATRGRQAATSPVPLHGRTAARRAAGEHAGQRGTRYTKCRVQRSSGASSTARRTPASVTSPAASQRSATKQARPASTASSAGAPAYRPLV